MSHEIEEIAEKALMLSSNARAQLAEILLESLDYEEDFVVSPEWMTEIRRRCREIDSGEVELLPGEEALAGWSPTEVFMKPYRLHPEALQEVDDAAAFYKERQPGLEKRFLDALQDAIVRIRRDHPARRLLGAARRLRRRQLQSRRSGASEGGREPCVSQSALPHHSSIWPRSSLRTRGGFGIWLRKNAGRD